MIHDIKFKNTQAYLLKDIDLTLEQCEFQIKKIDYEFFYEPYKHIKEEKAENTKFPSIIYAFYSLVFSSNQVPAPQILIDTYFSLYSGQIQYDGETVFYAGQTFKKSAVIGRILRTYPSLVRDLHFYLMLVQAHCFDEVIYSCKTDVSGKDILIRHNHKEYELSLYVDTTRSRKFKSIKNLFRHNYNNEIKLPLSLNSARKIGDFFVYSQKDIQTVKQQVV